MAAVFRSVKYGRLALSVPENKAIPHLFLLIFVLLYLLFVRDPGD
jgi:hypothetical protein